VKFFTVAVLLLGLVLISVDAESSDVVIPLVETWQETIAPFTGANMGHRTRIIVKWHIDPQGSGYEGASMYYVDSEGSIILFAKSWNFQKDGRDYTWVESRTALKLDNGEWFVGETGEMLLIERRYGPTNEVLAVKYQFTRGNSLVNRIIDFK